MCFFVLSLNSVQAKTMEDCIMAAAIVQSAAQQRDQGVGIGQIGVNIWKSGKSDGESEEQIAKEISLAKIAFNHAGWAPNKLYSKTLDSCVNKM